MEINMDKTTYIAGRPYAKMSEIKPGDMLEADGGFICLKEGERVKVVKDADGSLFVPCKCGGHNLDGQADDGEHLIGLYLVESLRTVVAMATV